jgi:hypothetical protein
MVRQRSRCENLLWSLADYMSQNEQIELSVLKELEILCDV